jgi:hypothetical protein
LLVWDIEIEIYNRWNKLIWKNQNTEDWAEVQKMGFAKGNSSRYLFFYVIQ